MNHGVFNSLFRRWWLLLGIATIVSGLVFALNQRSAPVYRASARVLVNQVQSPGPAGYSDLLASEHLVATYSELVHSGPVLQETIQSLKLPLSPSTLDEKITTKVILQTQLVQITVEDTDATRASAIANNLADTLVRRARTLQNDTAQATLPLANRDVDDTRRTVVNTMNQLNEISITDSNPVIIQERAHLNSQLSLDEDRYRRALDTQQRLALSQAQVLTGVSVAAPASVPTTPVRPTSSRSGMLAALLGLLIAGIVGIAIIYLDDHITSPEQLRQRLGLASIAVVARQKKLLTDPQQFGKGEIGNALRFARASIEGTDAKIISISGVREHDGATTVAAHWATLEAHGGKRVVLVDGNLRQPAVHRLFNIRNKEGLSTLLTTPSVAVTPLLQHGPHGLHILTSGPTSTDATDLLDSPRVADILDHLRTDHDLIIIDTAPVLSALDAAVLQRHIDGAVLVINRHRTSRTLARALDILQQATTNILGTVLTEHRPRTARFSNRSRNAAAHAPNDAVIRLARRSITSESSTAVAVERGSN